MQSCVRRFERQIPAIVLTGDISTQTCAPSPAEHCTHFDKPVEAAGLLRAVAHLLDSLRNDDPARRTEAHPVEGPFLDNSLRGRRRRDYTRDASRDARPHTAGLSRRFASCEAFLARADAAEARDVCLSTRMLPGMDGFELLSQLSVGKSALASIMITGNGDVSMAVRAMQAGAVGFSREAVRSCGTSGQRYPCVGTKD